MVACHAPAALQASTNRRLRSQVAQLVARERNNQALQKQLQAPVRYAAEASMRLRREVAGARNALQVTSQYLVAMLRNTRPARLVLPGSTPPVKETQGARRVPSDILREVWARRRAPPALRARKEI